MKRNKKVKIIVLILLLMVIVVGYFFGYKWINSMFLSPEENVIAVLEFNKSRKFSGVIINKYIDPNEHNYKKVVILENKLERTLYFDFEASGLFDFFKINDTIIKTKDNLKVRIIRNNLDTVYNMKFLYMSLEEYHSKKK